MDDFICAIDDLVLYRLLVKAMEAAGWEVKELGVPVQFLSLDMHLTLDPDGRCIKIHLSQLTYIVDLVEQFDLTRAAEPRGTTPMVKCTALMLLGNPFLLTASSFLLSVHCYTCPPAPGLIFLLRLATFPGFLLLLLCLYGWLPSVCCCT